MTKKPDNNKRGPLRGFGIYIVFALILFGTFFFLQRLNAPTEPEVLTYNELQTLITDGSLDGATISWTAIDTDLNSYRINISENDKVTYTIVLSINSWTEIEQQLTANHIPYYKEKSGVSFWDILSILIPIILLVSLGVFLFRTMRGGGANKQAFDFAKSQARLTSSKTTTFADVAGCDEEKEELEEVVDFLKFPKKYRDIGARIPRGVLLIGAPGTGKTLLARAVSGEAKVPFFSISGSDFVEMFVGVGASRVRDLFKVAKQNAPCIIFIDEIDAVGRQRGAGLGGGHDEREQTLNQLLVEMDGFEQGSGVIVIAATNRADILDPALLRPGRFDRRITIDLPDVRGREGILKVHARNKQFADDVNFANVAQRTPGFSGADIENLLNESALLAARDNRTVIEAHDIDEATDRVILGPAKRSRKISDKEKEIIAYHEAGHAVIGLKLEHSNVVQKVTIVARGRAGGYNLMMPEEETFLESKKSLSSRIVGYLGGRVAEELVFGDVTTGAYQDFQTATKIARAMVTEYGMSDLGPVQYESNSGDVFLGRDYFQGKNFSDQIALEIDVEVRKIITDAYNLAEKILTDNRKLLDTIANYLMKVETLTKQDLDEILETGKLSRAYEIKEEPKKEPTKEVKKEPEVVELKSSSNVDKDNNEA